MKDKTATIFLVICLVLSALLLMWIGIECIDAAFVADTGIELLTYLIVGIWEWIIAYKGCVLALEMLLGEDNKK